MNTCSFVIVDDDPTVTFIHKFLIKRIAQTEAVTFTRPYDGLEFLVHHLLREEHAEVVLLLDINMPEMTGWDFLDHFDRLEESVKGRVKIFLVSSSIDPADKAKAQDHPNVTGFILKPITEQSIIRILEQVDYEYPEKA